MARSKSVGPSERLLRRTECFFLVAAGIVSLYPFVAGNFLAAAGANVMFWRVLTWLRRLRSSR